MLSAEFLNLIVASTDGRDQRIARFHPNWQMGEQFRIVSANGNATIEATTPGFCVGVEFRGVARLLIWNLLSRTWSWSINSPTSRPQSGLGSISTTVHGLTT
jgi:hypothetical protein